MENVNVVIVDDNPMILNTLDEVIVDYRITCNNGNQRTLINP